MERATPSARTHVSIEHDRMSAGDKAAWYDPADHTTVLPAYVRLVTMLRAMAPDAEVHLRSTEGQIVSAFWAQCMMEQVHDRVMERVAS